MKKLFVSLMAVAALVSCSKEEDGGIALDSKNKTVSITIENALPAGRADFTGGETTAQGEAKVAQATSLKVLFAKEDGTILRELSLTAQGSTDNTHKGVNSEYVAATANPQDEGTYTWHNVPWSVTKIAVVRYEAGDINKGSVVEGTTNLEDVEKAAKSEALNVARPASTIVLYASEKLTDSKNTHRVDDVIYHVWEASVKVAPALARFEIDRVYCEDLGTHPDNKGTEYSYDELDILSMVWTAAGKDGKTYDVPVNKTIVRGQDKDGKDIVTPIVGTLKSALVGEGDEQTTTMVKPTTGVWSWNIDPATTQFGSMKVDMNAYAYDYKLQDNNTPLTITKLAANADGSGDVEFEAGCVYKMSIDFLEKNIADDDKLCVQVTVAIDSWSVQTVYPVFSK